MRDTVNNMSLPCKLNEAHYCNLQSQSNVYGLTKITMPCGLTKMLVASLRGKVVAMEFQQTRPSSKEVHFTYIPADAEIISIDAFNKHRYVVGITFTKPTEGKTCQFLNIYSALEPGSEFDLDSIAQGCQNVDLDFVPYQLYHTELLHDANNEIVFLLSGNDKTVHLFREDRYMRKFSEEPTEDYFPEFSDLPSNVTQMHCVACDARRRISAVGCMNGFVRVSVVNTDTKQIIESWTVQNDSPVTVLKLFTLTTEVECPSFVTQAIDTGDDGDIDFPQFHLLVATAVELAVVYRNVTEKGLADPLLLPDSDRFDCVLCCHVTDVDFDGQNEILLGTYGQELLIYKLATKLESLRCEDELNTSTSSTLSDGRADEYQLIWQRSFINPLLALDAVDITGDGLKEVLVVTLRGLHVLQHDLMDVAELCTERMKLLRQQDSQQEDIFKQLLSENLT